MSDRDWNKELAKIDKQLESVSDQALFPTPKGSTPAAQAQAIEARRGTRTWGAFLRLALVVALGVAVLFWPYGARCGAALFGYLGVVSVVIGGGIWSAVWTWRHRTARAHTLSLLVILWGLILGSIEVLPRVGYAKPDARHPMIWSCQ